LSTLHIKEFPDEVLVRLKSSAKGMRMSLRRYVTEVLATLVSVPVDGLIRPDKKRGRPKKT
jgi:hypothetical protein